MHEQDRIECRDEGDLDEEVDRRADQDRIDHRAGQVTLRVRALAGDLHRLLEAEQREHDARVRDREHDRLDCRALDEEATAGREVAPVEI